VLVLAGVALLVVAALSLNRIVAASRDSILQAVSAAAGREVAVDGISVSLWGGLGARLENVRVADDPRFSGGDFVRAATITLRAKFLPLLGGRFELSRIDAAAPQIQLIRNAAGEWNYASLAAHGQDAAPGTRSGSAAAPSAPEAPAPGAAQLVLVSQANIGDGVIVVTDRGQEPPRVTRVTQIDLALGDLSEATPVRFTLAAAVQAEVPNVSLRGSVGPLRNRAAIPMQIDGSLGPMGTTGARVEELHLKAVLTPESVRASQIDGRALDGTFGFTGEFPLAPGGALFLRGHLSTIDVARLLVLALEDSAPRMEGTGKLTADLHATGASAESITRSLAGSITAQVDGGVIKDVNLVNEVLERVSGLPRMGNLLSDNVKRKYAHLFAEQDTRFETLRAPLRIADARISTDDLAVIATNYGIRAKGWVAFDREADVSGIFALSAQFSSDIVADVKEARYIVDGAGQLAVPFRLRGRLGEATPRPELDQLLQKLGRAATHGAAANLLQDLLGGKQRRQPTPGGEKELNPIERRLRDLLGR
jgi:hypothetical protein